MRPEERFRLKLNLFEQLVIAPFGAQTEINTDPGNIDSDLSLVPLQSSLQLVFRLKLRGAIAERIQKMQAGQDAALAEILTPALRGQVLKIGADPKNGKLMAFGFEGWGELTALNMYLQTRQQKPPLADVIHSQVLRIMMLAPAGATPHLRK